MSSRHAPAQPFFARIVVGLDASGHGDHALRAARQLADAGAAQLTIVHAVGTSSAEWTPLDDPREVACDAGLVAQASRAAVRHVESVLGATDRSGRPQAEAVRTLAGRPSTVVLRVAREQDADLIVLGYDLDRPRLDFGSTVRAVVAGAPKAVWVQKHAPTEIRRILVPIDLSPDSLRALRAAVSLARMFGARVLALHAFSSARYVVSTWPDYPDFGAFVAIDEIRSAQRKDFETAMAGFDWDGVEHEIEFDEGEPARAILDAQRRADLIVMGTHGRGAVAAALLGGVAWSVLRHARLPVVALRHPEREFVHELPTPPQGPLGQAGSQGPKSRRG